MEQSVPKRRHVKFRRQGITQIKEYNITFFVVIPKILNKEWGRIFLFVS
jgi:hypothetical protein